MRRVRVAAVSFLNARPITCPSPTNTSAISVKTGTAATEIANSLYRFLANNNRSRTPGNSFMDAASANRNPAVW